MLIVYLPTTSVEKRRIRNYVTWGKNCRGLVWNTIPAFSFGPWEKTWKIFRLLGVPVKLEPGTSWIQVTIISINVGRTLLRQRYNGITTRHRLLSSFWEPLSQIKTREISGYDSGVSDYSGLPGCHDVSNVTRLLNLRRTLLPPPSKVQQKSLLLWTAQILKLEAESVLQKLCIQVPVDTVSYPRRFGS